LINKTIRNKEMALTRNTSPLTLSPLSKEYPDRNAKDPVAPERIALM
jgi:hypothetical protein